jgi:hypothetical protein
MSYTKMDLAAFGAKLGRGGYPGIGGARRAIGKAGWAEKDKLAGHALVNKYFEGSAETAPKPAKHASTMAADLKVVGKRAPKAEKVAKPAAKRGRKPGVKAAPIENSDEKQYTEGFGPAIITNENVQAHVLKRSPVVASENPRAQTDVLYHSHSTIIAALLMVSQRTPQEQELLERVEAEAGAMCGTTKGQAYRDAHKLSVSDTHPEGHRKAIPQAVHPIVQRPHIPVTPASTAASIAPDVSLQGTFVEQAPDHTPVVTPVLDAAQLASVARLKNSVKNMPDLGPPIKPYDLNEG